MKLNDYRCSNGHITEHLVKSGTDEVTCDCGEPALRIISPVSFHLEGASGHFPTAAMKWDRNHEEGAKVQTS